VSLTRGELLARAGLAAATPLTWPQSDAGRSAGPPATRPLRISTVGIEWPNGVHQQAQLDLGFPIQLVPLTSAEQIEAVLTNPESFDVFAGYSYQAMRIWFSRHLRPIDTHRIAAWPDEDQLRLHGRARVGEREEFELSAPVTLSICCFRYVPPVLALQGDERERYLDALNARVMTEIQLDGRAYCSNAVLRERFVLRACIVNFRTEAGDVDALLDLAAELGAKLHAKMRSAA